MENGGLRPLSARHGDQPERLLDAAVMVVDVHREFPARRSHPPNGEAGNARRESCCGSRLPSSGPPTSFSSDGPFEPRLSAEQPAASPSACLTRTPHGCRRQVNFSLQTRKEPVPGHASGLCPKLAWRGGIGGADRQPGILGEGDPVQGRFRESARTSARCGDRGRRCHRESAARRSRRPMR